MGTHPIFESDFDCLTDVLLFRLGETVDSKPLKRFYEEFLRCLNSQHVRSL